MLPRDLPAADVLPFARAADAHGFAELWVVEDCFFRGGIAQAATGSEEADGLKQIGLARPIGTQHDPPLIVSQDECDRFLDIFGRACVSAH